MREGDDVELDLDLRGQSEWDRTASSRLTLVVNAAVSTAESVEVGHIRMRSAISYGE